MKNKFSKILMVALLLAILVANVFVTTAPMVYAENSLLVTSPTGYTSADEVVYKTGNAGGRQVTANWGARGEVATFLSKKAISYYTGNYSFATLSSYQGGSLQSNAHSSALYSQLQSMMRTKSSHTTTYDETKSYYRYTDCLKNDTSMISSFYSGTVLGGSWGSSPSWNREHTWPNSKGLNGADENDIMMLRPTAEKENSSRGNTAYGLTSGYYDPGEATRGDCARIALYVYTRWGNTEYMWGKSGVIQNVDVLLAWMAEDPVDTWEMGRNDAVQSITGVRNVFVDYPELAWKLFSREMPEGTSTPSGNDNGGSGGNGGGAGDIDTSSFQQLVNNISTATTLTEKFDAIKQAVNAYNGYSDTEKQQLASSYQQLQEYINQYNADISTQNTNNNNALGVAVASMTGAVLLTAIALVFIKRLF